MIGNRPVAVKYITAFHAVAIFGIERGSEPRVFVADTYEGELRSKPKGCKIQYTKKGEPYFRHRNQREYLSDYMKVNF